PRDRDRHQDQVPSGFQVLSPRFGVSRRYQEHFPARSARSISRPRPARSGMGHAPAQPHGTLGAQAFEALRRFRTSAWHAEPESFGIRGKRIWLNITKVLVAARKAPPACALR